MTVCFCHRIISTTKQNRVIVQAHALQDQIEPGLSTLHLFSITYSRIMKQSGRRLFTFASMCTFFFFVEPLSFGREELDSSLLICSCWDRHRGHTSLGGFKWNLTPHQGGSNGTPHLIRVVQMELQTSLGQFKWNRTPHYDGSNGTLYTSLGQFKWNPTLHQERKNIIQVSFKNSFTLESTNHR